MQAITKQKKQKTDLPLNVKRKDITSSSTVDHCVLFCLLFTAFQGTLSLLENAILLYDQWTWLLLQKYRI